MNYSENPERYLAVDKNMDAQAIDNNEAIQALELRVMFFVVGDSGSEYLDLKDSRDVTNYLNWLDTLSEEERERELEDDFVGGGCH